MKLCACVCDRKKKINFTMRHNVKLKYQIEHPNQTPKSNLFKSQISRTLIENKNSPEERKIKFTSNQIYSTLAMKSKKKKN